MAVWFANLHIFSLWISRNDRLHICNFEIFQLLN